MRIYIEKLNPWRLSGSGTHLGVKDLMKENSKIWKLSTEIGSIFISQDRTSYEPKMFLFYYFTFTYFGKEFRDLNWLYSKTILRVTRLLG